MSAQKQEYPAMVEKPKGVLRLIELLEESWEVDRMIGGKPYECRVSEAYIEAGALSRPLENMLIDHMAVFGGYVNGVRKEPRHPLYEALKKPVQDGLLDGGEFHPRSDYNLSKYVLAGNLLLMLQPATPEFERVDAVWRTLNPAIYAVAD